MEFDTVPLPQRLTLVTLGVRDVARSRAFYEALGFAAAGFDSASIAFFRLGGTVLGVFAREALAADAGVSSGGDGFRGVTLAINLDSPREVDSGLARAVACGADLVKPGTDTGWGGYSGYFSDPDGHLWEIAHNPLWPNDANGHMQVPRPFPSQS